MTFHFVPSIPGYLYSAPLKKKFDTVDTARYFDYLMRYLHGENVEYFIHGEDWGSIITTYLAQIYPERVKGIHLTMPIINHDKISAFHTIKNSIFSTLFLSRKEIKANFSKRGSIFNFIKLAFKEAGLFLLNFNTYSLIYEFV